MSFCVQSIDCCLKPGSACKIVALPACTVPLMAVKASLASCVQVIPHTSMLRLPEVLQSTSRQLAATEATSISAAEVLARQLAVAAVIGTAGKACHACGLDHTEFYSNMLTDKDFELADNFL